MDVTLPDLRGLRLGALIGQRSAHTAVVLISGCFYREDGATTAGLEKDVFIGFISKPFDLKEVRLVAHQALKRAREGDHADGPHSAG